MKAIYFYRLFNGLLVATMAVAFQGCELDEDPGSSQ